MEIERVLKLTKHCRNDKEAIEMIICNRIDYYCGDEIGPAVTMRKADILAEDILAWHKMKIEQNGI